jgi:hypothetical protein
VTCDAHRQNFVMQGAWCTSLGGFSHLTYKCHHETHGVHSSRVYSKNANKTIVDLNYFWCFDFEQFIPFLLWGKDRRTNVFGLLESWGLVKASALLESQFSWNTKVVKWPEITFDILGLNSSPWFSVIPESLQNHVFNHDHNQGIYHYRILTWYIILKTSVPSTVTGNHAALKL